LPDVGELPLTDDLRHHLRRVLRLSDGARLVVSDGAGRFGAGRLVASSVVLEGPVVTEPLRAPRIVLVQALPKGRGFDEAVRLAVEVGVDAVVPLVTERGVVRPDATGGRALVERARAVALAAAGQARRAHVPTIEEPARLEDALAGLEPDDVVLVGVPGAPGPREVLGEPGGAPERVLIVVGPEGGLTVDELELARGRGARALGLGPSVLRSEHAGLALVAVLSAWFGRMEREASGPDGATAWR
jgi:16S rRNA (uracil1498-N3)-methyltransferase